ncbi:MAG: hypothetical protein V3V31_08745 [Methylococcales bacterium]
MNRKTIIIAGTVLILGLLLAVSIKVNKSGTSEVGKTNAELANQRQQNQSNLTELEQEIRFIVKDSIEEEIQKEVQKEIERSENTR